MLGTTTALITTVCIPDKISPLCSPQRRISRLGIVSRPVPSHEEIVYIVPFHPLNQMACHLVDIPVPVLFPSRGKQTRTFFSYRPLGKTQNVPPAAGETVPCRGTARARSPFFSQSFNYESLVLTPKNVHVAALSARSWWIRFAFFCSSRNSTCVT